MDYCDVMAELGRLFNNNKTAHNSESQIKFDLLIQQLKKLGVAGFDLNFLYKVLNNKTWADRRRVMWRVKHSKHITSVGSHDSFRNRLYYIDNPALSEIAQTIKDYDRILPNCATTNQQIGLAFQNGLIG